MAGITPLRRDVRAALLFALWHHQGGSSLVGLPLRAMLGLGEYERLSTEQVAEAKRVGDALELAAAAGKAQP